MDYQTIVSKLGQAVSTLGQAHTPSGKHPPTAVLRLSYIYTTYHKMIMVSGPTCSPGDEYAELAERVLVEVVGDEVLYYAERHCQATGPHVPLGHSLGQVYRQVQVADHASLDRFPFRDGMGWGGRRGEGRGWEGVD